MKTFLRPKIICLVNFVVVEKVSVAKSGVGDSSAGFLLIQGQTAEGGRLQISHRNSPGIREQINNLADTPAAYLYQILTTIKGFSQKCALDLINKSFTLEARIGASKSSINTSTLIVTPQRRSQNAAFEREMAARDIKLEIPNEVKEVRRRRR